MWGTIVSTAAATWCHSRKAAITIMTPPEAPAECVPVNGGDERLADITPLHNIEHYQDFTAVAQTPPTPESLESEMGSRRAQGMSNGVGGSVTITAPEAPSSSPVSPAVPKQGIFLRAKRPGRLNGR